MTPDEVYALALAESEDEAKAQEAASEYAAAILRAGQSAGGSDG